MKLFFKSAPLQMPELTRLRDPIDIQKWWATARLQYNDTTELLLNFGSPGGPGIHSLQRGLTTFHPFSAQLYFKSPKTQRPFIPDIRQYLTSNGITDRAKQDAFIDINDQSVTPRMLIDKEAADVHEKMARATRQSAFGRNNPGFEFGESAEIGSHDFGDIRYFEHPRTGASVPLFHVRRAVVVHRAVNSKANSTNLFVDSNLHSRAMEAFRLGDHPSYGYLGITHTHPALSHVSPSPPDMQCHDNATPYGYSQIIRPGINMKEFTRQVIARYGSSEEALRQWIQGGADTGQMAARYSQFLKNQDAEGKDKTGMPLRRDARLFMVRQSTRPLKWESHSASRHLDLSVNYGLASDFTSVQPHHVLYLGENNAKRGTAQSIISRPSFHAAVGTDAPIMQSDQMGQDK